MTYIQDDVTPTSVAPSHNIRLVDASGNKVLLRLKRVTGTDRESGKTLSEDDPEGLVRNTFPNQAIRFAQQGGKYADLQPPFQAFEQDTWEGGRGIRLFEADKTRYADSYSVLTHNPNQVTLGGAPRFSGGNFNGDEPLEHIYIMPGNFSGHSSRATALYDTDKFIGRRFSPTSSCVVNRVMVILGQTGTAPGTFRVDIYSDNAGVPNASVANGTLTVAAFGTEETSRTVIIDLDAAESLTGGTNYWLIVQSVTNGSATNHWWVLTDDTAVGVSARSADGTTWSEASPYPAPYIGVLDRYAAASDKVGFKFFEYKRQLYAIKLPENGDNATVFRNGDRGAADSNSGNLDKLIDATKAWTTNQYAGAIALIIKGPGANEHQPWRNIVSNTGTALTVSPNWEITHTTATDYVILGSDYWELVYAPAVAGNVNVCVAGDIFLLSFENSNVIRRVREYNKAGVWTTQLQSVSNFLADKLTSTREPETGKTALYAYNNDYLMGPAYWKAYLPPAWGDPYVDLGEIQSTDSPWNTAAITNVTQRVGIDGTEISIAGAFTTGLVASKDLDTPVTVEEGNRYGVHIRSSVATGIGELTMKLSNRTYANQQKLLADYVFHTAIDRYEVATKVTTLVPSTGVHTDKPKIYDGSDASSDTIPLTTTNKLVAVFAKKVNSVQFNISVANVVPAITLTMRYFNGEEFVLHTITDNTASGGTTFALTGKQTVTFTLPGDWEQYTVDDGTDAVTGYALEFIVDGVGLTATTALLEIAGKDTEAYANTAFGNGRDGNGSSDETFIFKVGDAFAVGKSEKFDRVVVTLGSTVNAQAASLAMFYFNGEKLTSGTVSSDGTASGGATLAQTGTITTTTPSDWKPQTFGGVTAYFLHFQPSATLTEETMLAEIAVYLDEQTYTMDAVISDVDTWTWLTAAITPGSNFADEMVIRNVSFTLNTNLATQVLYLNGGVRLIRDAPIYKLMGGHRATNILAYGAEGARVEPFILFEDQRHHRIDTLNGDALVPVLITAFETVASETNGRAATHSGVYLYSNLGPRLVRYFEGSLESVGPDLDEGLPFDRQGVISAIVPYAGDAVIYAVDAATRDPDFESSVILRAGSGVHELYRAPRGEQIRDLRAQVTPGLKSDRLWMNVGAQLVWIPLPSYTSDPLKDLDSDGNSNYTYLHDGHLDLGYLTDGMQGVAKVFVSLTLVTKNLSAGACYITAYYRADDATAWTKVTTSFTTSPVQELAFTANYINAKKLQVRLRLRRDGGQSLLVTPVIEAVIIKGVTIYPASYTYDFTAMLADKMEDLEQRQHTHLAQAEMVQLDTWRNAGTVLTLTDLYVPWNSRKIIIQSLNYRPAMLITLPHEEQYIFQMQALDVTL